MFGIVYDVTLLLVVDVRIHLPIFGEKKINKNKYTKCVLYRLDGRYVIRIQSNGHIDIFTKSYSLIGLTLLLIGLHMMPQYSNVKFKH